MIVTGYLGLLFASFIAATLVPAGSEIGLAALYATGKFSLHWLVMTASLGNTLGSVVNWFLGRFAMQFTQHKWFPFSITSIESAHKWYGKYGRWSLLLSWVPIIGDPITLVAGILREPFWRFLSIVAVAKTARYILLAWFIA